MRGQAGSSRSSLRRRQRVGRAGPGRRRRTGPGYQGCWDPRSGHVPRLRTEANHLDKAPFKRIKYNKNPQKKELLPHRLLEPGRPWAASGSGVARVRGLRADSAGRAGSPSSFGGWTLACPGAAGTSPQQRPARETPGQWAGTTATRGQSEHPPGAPRARGEAPQHRLRRTGGVGPHSRTLGRAPQGCGDTHLCEEEELRDSACSRRTRV